MEEGWGRGVKGEMCRRGGGEKLNSEGSVSCEHLRWMSGRSVVGAMAGPLDSGSGAFKLLGLGWMGGKAEDADLL